VRKRRKGLERVQKLFKSGISVEIYLTTFHTFTLSHFP
jgi:hypothetical protein